MTKKYHVMIVDDYQPIHEDFQKTLLGHNPSKAHEKLSSMEMELFGGEPEEQDHEETLPIELAHASQGKEALAQVKEQLTKDNHFSLIFMDFRMPPGWNGVKTIKQIWKVDPQVEMVMTTAYSDSTWEAIHQEFDYTDQLLFLRKPFQRKTVQNLTKSLLRKWDLRNSAQTGLDPKTSLILAHHQPLVVMCMYCKRIKKDDQWLDESSRVQGKNAAITHSMCPGCFEEARTTFQQGLDFA